MADHSWHLKGKSVLLTGAAGGIGAAVAHLLAARQAHLSLIDLRAEALAQVAGQLGDDVLFQAVDITQTEAITQAVTATVERFGRLDVAVVNAGVVAVGSVEHSDPQAFERVIEVNLLGSWRTVRAVLPHIVDAQGYILFVSSLAGTNQGPLNAAYNSSKAGLNAFANTLRLEVQGLGVDIGVAHLIYTATDTGRLAVEHPFIRSLPGLPRMKPEPVEKTAAMLVRGIAHRSRTVGTFSAHLSLFSPDVSQRLVERLARRRRWAAVIRAQEQADK
jgi:NAD(P)-dependent dehydrogenase (short-subunit alcohol dehydrogenase family)